MKLHEGGFISFLKKKKKRDARNSDPPIYHKSWPVPYTAQMYACALRTSFHLPRNTDLDPGMYTSIVYVVYIAMQRPG